MRIRIAVAVAATVSVAGAALLPISGASAADVPEPAPTTSTAADPDPVCDTAIPDLSPAYAAAIPVTTNQVIVARGVAKRDYDNLFERWQRTAGCWQKVGAVWSYNGANGWHARPWTGSLRSPIGTFSLTDTGGRLRNPGTTMKYHYGPQRYERGGYKISYPVQLYNYVIAINYNRRIGKAPRDTRQPDRTTGSGYWIHQRGLGVTRGCLSLTKSQLITTMRWLRKADRPYIVMGPQSVIGNGGILPPVPD